jgi:hypothetical protein
VNLETLLKYRISNKTSAWNRGHVAFRVTTYAILATTAIVLALGFRFNWQARVIEQTGMLVLESSITPTGIQVSLDGKVLPASLNQRIPYLFPGDYRLQITAEGYQSFDRTISISPNKATRLQNISLLTTEASAALVLTTTQQKIPTADAHGLEVRNLSELWQDGRYLTRLSQPITTPQFYPGKHAIAYQQGASLWLYNLDTKATQLISALPDASLVEYGFTDGGRGLLVKQADKLYQRALVIR